MTCAIGQVHRLGLETDYAKLPAREQRWKRILIIEKLESGLELTDDEAKIVALTLRALDAVED